VLHSTLMWIAPVPVMAKIKPESLPGGLPSFF
jgi:hypothetical protein